MANNKYKYRLICRKSSLLLLVGIIFLFHNTGSNFGTIRDTTLDVQQQPMETPEQPEQQPQIQLCKWMVIAGDSNSRKPYFHWRELEKQTLKNRVVEGQWLPIADYNYSANTPCNSGDRECQVRSPEECRRDYPKKEGMWKWTDNEMVLLGEKDCRIVTLKFLRNQKSEVNRLVNLTNHSPGYCPGYALTNAIPKGYQRPLFPDTIWFSHGIWGLPNEGGSYVNESLSCTQRFEPHVRQLLQWKQQHIQSLTWQTLFPINHHPKTTNAYLKWDYECQKQVAQQLPNGLLQENLYDMYQYVRPQVKEVIQSGDYHFKDPSRVVRQYLEKCCGGWDQYWEHYNVRPLTSTKTSGAFPNRGASFYSKYGTSRRPVTRTNNNIDAIQRQRHTARTIALTRTGY